MAEDQEWEWVGNTATREQPDGTDLMLNVTRHQHGSWSAHAVARRAGQRVAFEREFFAEREAACRWAETAAVQAEAALEGGVGPFEELVTNLAVTLLTSRETGIPLRDIALPPEWFEKALALVEPRLARAGIKA